MESSRLSIFYTFFKIGCVSFGAAAGEVIVEILVEKKKWMSLEKTREAYAVAAFAPGPFHVNVVLNLGYQLQGIAGMLLAGAGFILPSFILAVLIAALLHQPEITGIFTERPGIVAGLQAGVAGLLLNVILKFKEDLIHGRNEYLILGFLLGVMIAGEYFGQGVSLFAVILIGAFLAYLLPLVRGLYK